MKLTQKLAAISKSAGTIQKNGRYSYRETKYDYLKIDDIYDHFQKPLSENAVVFSTNVLEWRIESNLIVGIIEGVFSDGESQLTCQVGSAARAGDKMMRNLMQNAVKQIFLQVFCISSGDPDPDGEPNTELKKESNPNWKTLPDDIFEKRKQGIADGWESDFQNVNDKIGITSKGIHLLLSPDQFEEIKSLKN